ncbi:MAG: alpha/beta fold hydrolase [bacterium]|nr:alpha/beta fold hydrolase [bacterium]
MKNIIKKLCTTIAFITFLILVSPGMKPLFAEGSQESLNLNYPIILVHGWAGADKYVGIADYFHNIKPTLEQEGADVYAADLDSFNVDFDPGTYNSTNKYYRGETPARSDQLRSFILYVLSVTKAQKVNIIAHSQGGITARYVISNMTAPDGSPMYSKAASLVMISSPNRGTYFSNLIIGLSTNSGLSKWASDLLLNSIWGELVCGDNESNFLAPAFAMSKEYMTEVFNPNTPDITPALDMVNGTGVRYFSYAGKAFGPTINLPLYPVWLIIKRHNGENDGIVPVESAKWGTWMGTVTGMFGVDHWMEQNQVMGITPGFDGEGFYLEIARMLEQNGF